MIKKILTTILIATLSWPPQAFALRPVASGNFSADAGVAEQVNAELARGEKLLAEWGDSHKKLIRAIMQIDAKAGPGVAHMTGHCFANAKSVLEYVAVFYPRNKQVDFSRISQVINNIGFLKVMLEYFANPPQAKQWADRIWAGRDPSMPPHIPAVAEFIRENHVTPELQKEFQELLDAASRLHAEFFAIESRLRELSNAAHETNPVSPRQKASSAGQSNSKHALSKQEFARPDSSASPKSQHKRKRYDSSIKGKKRTGIGRWELLDLLRRKLQELPEGAIAKIRQAKGLSGRRKILIAYGLDEASGIDGKFLAPELDVLLRKNPVITLPALPSRRHMLRYAGKGRHLIAYSDDGFNFIVKIPRSSKGAAHIRDSWVGKGYKIAKERLIDLAVPTIIVDVADGPKKPFSYRLKKGGIQKADLAIIQVKVVPVFERLKQLAKAGNISEAQDLVDKYKDFVVAMFRRGVMDFDFTYPYYNCGIDLETGKIYLFDFGDLEMGKDNTGIYFENISITNKYFYDDLMREVSERVAKYYAKAPLTADDFFTSSGKSLFGADLKPEKSDNLKMAFPYSEEEIRDIFMNHGVKKASVKNKARSVKSPHASKSFSAGALDNDALVVFPIKHGLSAAAEMTISTSA